MPQNATPPRICYGSVPARKRTKEYRTMSRSLLRMSVMCLALGLAATALAQPVPPNNTPDAVLRSTPDNVVWGYFAADIAPALRIKSGQTVKIDTVSHSGVNTPDDPVTYFGRAGIPPNEVLKDAIDIFNAVK